MQELNKYLNSLKEYEAGSDVRIIKDRSGKFFLVTDKEADQIRSTYKDMIDYGKQLNVLSHELDNLFMTEEKETRKRQISKSTNS